MRPGDYCELKGSRLYIPEGKYFCLWALQSVLPLLPVKQRRVAEDNDWIPDTFRVSCPDPDGMVIMRIEQIIPATERQHAQGVGEHAAPGVGGQAAPVDISVPRLGREGPPSRLLVDTAACSGCGACELACISQHGDGHVPSLPRIRVEKYKIEGRHYPVVCHQCGVARCVQVCAQGALSRHRVTGAVLVDAGLCVRCGECVQACPFGAIALGPETALPSICDLCGGDPACVKSCATGALRFGRAGAFGSGGLSIGRSPARTS